MATELHDREEQWRNDRQRDQGQYLVHPPHDEQHADQEHERVQQREEPVHGQGLDGERVGGETIQEVAHFTSAMERQRERLPRVR